MPHRVTVKDDRSKVQMGVLLAQRDNKFGDCVGVTNTTLISRWLETKKRFVWWFMDCLVR